MKLRKTSAGGGIVKAKVAGEVTKKAKVSRVALENLTAQTNQIKLGDDPVVMAVVRKGRDRRALVGKKAVTSKKVKTSPEPMDVDLGGIMALLDDACDVIPDDVTNVDAEDTNDPQAASENVQEIYAYLRQLEDRYPVTEDHLSGSRISVRMRAVLINWLADVHSQFKLLQETLYLTVDILDRFLSAEASKMQYKQLQLVGVSSMLVACKYEEMYVPEVGDFVYITDNAYDSSAILSMELKILRVLDFNLGKPTAINFVRRNSKTGSVQLMEHSLAKYILEECFTVYPLASVKPSQKAAAALLVSLKLSSPKADLASLWDANLAFYSGYSLSALASTTALISGRLIEVQKCTKYRAAFAKYDSASKGHASRIPARSIDALQGFCDGSLFSC